MKITDFNSKNIEFAKAIILNNIPHDRHYAVHQKDLKSSTGYNTRFIRLIIQSLRDDGYAICSTTSEGYWQASNSLELGPTIAQLKTQRNTLDDTIQALETTFNNMRRGEANES